MMEGRKGVRLHLRLIEFIGLIVPRRMRSEWRKEWEAERRYRENLLAEWERLSWRSKLELLRRSVGAFWDAVWLLPQRREDEMIQDLRFGLRMLIRAPGFTFIAILTLALGIGANTAMFSVVNAVLLSPLPYAESDHLLFLTERNQQSDRAFISWPNYLDWRSQNQVFENIGVYNRESYNLTGNDGEPERLLAAQVSADLFSTLGIQAFVGRTFTEDEDRVGSEPVVVLSYGLWQRRFGGDPNILARALTLNDRSYSVIGVMPSGFQFPTRVEIWVPAAPIAARDWQHRSTHPGLYGVARLKRNVTIDQARSEMNRIAEGLERHYPATNRDHRVTVTPLLESIVNDVSWGLWIMLAAAGVVLAVTCANIANLLLVRATLRQREMAIRAALGARRSRLIRQLITESLLLALLGGVAGCLLANWSIKLFVAGWSRSLPRASEVQIDEKVLIFAAATSVLTGILFGLAPAWQTRRFSLQQTLKDVQHNLVPGRQLVRNGLVIAEMALALVLLVGAGLLLRSFYFLNRVDPGFVIENVQSFSLALPTRKYSTTEQRIEFFRQLDEKLKEVRGVQSASLASGLPFGNSSWRMPFAVEGSTISNPTEAPVFEACLVGPDFFRTLGIPLRSGRLFNEEDNRQHLATRDLTGWNDSARAVAGLNAIIVDEEFARRYWPGEDAVGKRITLGPNFGPGSPQVMVIGVVGRVKMDKLSLESNLVQGYFSYLQFPFSNMTAVMKATLDPAMTIAAARRQVQSLDANQPIYNIRTLEQIRGDSIAPERLNLTLLGLFAALALTLAAVGIYGVVSYTAEQRVQEIGLRVAMGASTADVIKLVVGQGMKLAAIGLAIGLLASIALTRFLKNLLFGVSTTDPITLSGIALLLVGVAFCACYLPARRAAEVDPLVALRGK
jgi:putative ABC transport system permease protein